MWLHGRLRVLTQEAAFTLVVTLSLNALMLALALSLRQLICPRTKSSRSLRSSRSSRQEILSWVKG